MAYREPSMQSNNEPRPQLSSLQRAQLSLKRFQFLTGFFFIAGTIAHGVSWEYGMSILGDSLQALSIVMGFLFVAASIVKHFIMFTSASIDSNNELRCRCGREIRVTFE